MKELNKIEISVVSGGKSIFFHLSQTILSIIYEMQQISQEIYKCNLYNNIH